MNSAETPKEKILSSEETIILERDLIEASGMGSEKWVEKNAIPVREIISNDHGKLAGLYHSDRQAAVNFIREELEKL